jgi:tRNA nucleotidyltransferase (CCA-adding enzyme)
VRDELIPEAPEPKDVDFVVTGLTLEEIELILSSLGKVFESGKSFGIVKAVIDGDEFDFSIPRTEKKTGPKHTDFEVVTDPNASVEDDMARRDFTMNALFKDSEGNVVDIFGGREDIRNKVVRAVGNPDQRFVEDPLRMLRAIQFASRLGFDIEEETRKGIKRNFQLLSSIAAERISMELEKAWTKGRKDSGHLIGLLKDLGVGEFLFGFGFEPLEISPSFDDARENVLANFVAFFLRGGAPKSMRPTKEMSNLLELAKEFIKGTPNVWQRKGITKEQLSLLAKVFGRLGKHYSSFSAEILPMLDKPLVGRELDITGQDVMKLGFFGKDIGLIMTKVLVAIHDDELENNYDEIINYIEEM